MVESSVVVASGSDGAVLGVVVILGIAAYLIPTIIGSVRKVPDIGSVLMINIFLGWTFIGWVIAMAMAMRSRPQESVVNVYTGYQAGGAGPAPQHASAAQPGWYPDPYGQAAQRYFDGASWTGYVG